MAPHFWQTASCMLGSLHDSHLFLYHFGVVSLFINVSVGPKWAFLLASAWQNAYKARPPSPLVVQGFAQYMQAFLEQKQAKIVVEVGSDTRLSLAARLAPHCQALYSVNFPGHAARMAEWHELYKSLGIQNIEIVSGDALHLSALIPHADIILLQNVLLAQAEEDTVFMWRYSKGEVTCPKEDFDALLARFRKAEEQGHREFLSVASPGHIVRFGRPDPHGRFERLLTETLEVSPGKIRKESLLYDSTEEIWEAYIIDNVPSPSYK